MIPFRPIGGNGKDDVANNASSFPAPRQTREIDTSILLADFFQTRRPFLVVVFLRVSARPKSGGPLFITAFRRGGRIHRPVSTQRSAFATTVSLTRLTEELARITSR